MFKRFWVWGLLPLGMFFASTTATACTAYCICNGVSAQSCTKKASDCTSPKTTLCASASCGMKALCCCSERVFEPSGDDGSGTLVLKLTDCTKPVTCEEMCGGGGGFLVHGDDPTARAIGRTSGEEVSTLLQEVMDPESRARRARLVDWALVEVEMLEGREVNYRPIYASSTKYAVAEAMTSGIENYMMPGHSTRISMNEGPPGGILKDITVDQDGLRDHLLEVLGDQLLELEGSKIGLAIVLDVDGQLDSIQVLYSEPIEFAKILVPELRKAFPKYAGHQGNGRTMDVFSPNVHSGGTMLGLHHGGSYLLDVHPFRY